MTYKLPEHFATLHHEDGYFTTKNPERDMRFGGPIRTAVYSASQMQAAYAAGQRDMLERAIALFDTNSRTQLHEADVVRKLKEILNEQ